jgi:hypothetical protein
MSMNRWQASGIHFLISLLVFCLLLLVILLVWYPGLLFELNGGWEGLRIVIGVDLVLGPLLTLIVYKADKPSLKFDLTAIAVFQSLCLSAGVWVVYEERPVVLVFEYDALYSLSAREYKQYGNDLAALEQFAGKYPKQVFIELPGDNTEAFAFSSNRQLNESPLYGDAASYKPLPESNVELIRDGENFKEIGQAAIEQELADDCVLARFVSSSKQGYVCLDSSRTITDFY